MTHAHQAGRKRGRRPRFHGRDVEREPEDNISTATATKHKTATATKHKTRPVTWTCDRCEMTSTWIEGRRSAPPNWDRVGRRHYCLHCRRERAVEAALEKAGDVGLEARAKVRSAAVVEFEILRDPDRTESEIAQAAHTSVGAVRAARKRVRIPRR